jgi:hypothetical protein
MIASKRFGCQNRHSSVTKGEEPKANERQNHRHTAAGGDEQRQDRGPDGGDPQAGSRNDAGRIDGVVDREPDRDHAAILREGAQDGRARVAERDRPIEGEIDDRRDDEAWGRAIWRQADIFGADKVIPESTK